MSITFEEMHINALKELYELNDLFKAFKTSEFWDSRR